MSLKIGSVKFSLLDAVEVSNSPGMRIGHSPFGTAGRDTWYAGRSVPWKGVRGIDMLQQVNPGVARAIGNARAISQSKRGIRGVVLCQMTSGALKVMPRKSAEQSMGRPNSVDGSFKDRVSMILSTKPTYSALLTPAQVNLPIGVNFSA